MLDDSDYSIVSKYQSEYRGVVQYYLLAHNVWLVQPIEMGQRNVAAQNAGRQTLILGRCDGTQVQSNNRDEQWPEEVPQGGCPAWREETTGCTIWRDPLTTEARCNSR